MQEVSFNLTDDDENPLSNLSNTVESLSINTGEVHDTDQKVNNFICNKRFQKSNTKK